MITGDGPIPCEILFVGEAPGKTEIEEGKIRKISISNRTPKLSEINLFKDALFEEINLVSPKIVVTLGNNHYA